MHGTQRQETLSAKCSAFNGFAGVGSLTPLTIARDWHDWILKRLVLHRLACRIDLETGTRTRWSSRACLPDSRPNFWAVRRQGSAMMSFLGPELERDMEPTDAISPREERDVVVRAFPSVGNRMSEVEGCSEYRDHGSLWGRWYFVSQR